MPVSPFSNWGRSAQEPGQCAGQNLSRFCGFDDCLFLCRLCSVAYGVSFFSGAETLVQRNGFELVKFFFLLTFAAAIPAIISGGIAERARFHPQSIATALLVGLVYPFFEGIAWNQRFGIQAGINACSGAEFMISPARWLCMPSAAGRRCRRCCCWVRVAVATPKTAPSRPIRHRAFRFLALGAWILTVGWFGFNVMSAQTTGQDQWPGRDQLVDGDGRRHTGGSHRWARMIRVSRITAAWPVWSRSAPVPI
jgi:hypothetical protein